MNISYSVQNNVIEYDQMENITKEFTRLKDYCYLDNTGAALYPESLIKKVGDDFVSNIYMNPHSDTHSLDCIEGVRKLILQHFHTNSSEYSVIFTSGATHALKLVIESFQFTNNKNNHGAFVHLRDNHTSVLGLRELVNTDNVDIFYISHEDFLNTLSYSDDDSNSFKENLPKKTGNALLAYPAQNNFNGFKYPINCMSDIKKGYLNKFVNKSDVKDSYNWYILLDAASFVSTNCLNLSVVKPDFVCLSFYKIFGYPTGLGALLVKNDCIRLLSEKKYYGGGTIDTVLNTERFFARKNEVSERFEDGTISFLSIMALRHCFEILNNLIPKAINNNVMDTISYHTYYLAKELYIRLKELKHQNGRKAIVFYMDSDFTNIREQGGMVTFNIVRDDGSFVGYKEFEKKSVLYKICIRSGCFCNSGSCQRHFKLSNKEIKDRYEAGHKCGGETDIIDGVPTGAIRVSFGYYNTYANVEKLVDMISQSYLSTYTITPKDNLIQRNKIKLHKQISYEKGSIKEHFCNVIETKSPFTLKDIIIYPIEHCGPFRIESSWNLCNEGLIYNKKWRIISTNDIIFNQNHMSLMSQINPEIDMNYNNMILHKQGMKSISIYLDAHTPSRSIIDECEIIRYDCGDEVASWISEAVKCPNLRLVKISMKKTRTKDLVNKEIHILEDPKNIILINMPSTYNTDEIPSVNSIRGNLVVNIPQESFTGDWDKVFIGNHEFQVEGRYSQNVKIYFGDKNDIPIKPMMQFSKDQVFALSLSFVKTISDSTKILELNSEINFIKINETRYNEIKRYTNPNQNLDPYKFSSNNFTDRLKCLLKKRKKYEISVL